MWVKVGVGDGGAVQRHFHVKPNFSLCLVEFWLSWVFDNFSLFITTFSLKHLRLMKGGTDTKGGPDIKGGMGGG